MNQGKAFWSMKQWFGVSALIAFLALPLPLHAQTQEEQDRLDALARYTVTGPMCQRLGMSVAEDAAQRFEAGVKAETALWQVDAAVVAKLVTAALQRQGRIFAIDLEAAAANAKSASELRKVREIFLRYGRTCLSAAADPLFGKIITVPPGYDLDSSATKVADELLEQGGMASWQTPAIQARGDMMMLAGACRAHIGHDRSDALVKAYGTSGDPRVREYYTRSFDQGLNDTEFRFSLAQCERAISATRRRIHPLATGG